MLSDNLREARKQKGLTQNQLADLIGVQRAVISKYESGMIEPSITQLINIAAALNSSLPELLGFKYGDGVLYSIKLSPELVKALGFPEDVRQLTTSNPELMMEIINEFSRQSPKKIALNTAFDRLNDSGQSEAVKRVEELTEIPRYRRTDAPPQSPEGKDTPADEKSTERPTEGQGFDLKSTP